MRCHRHHAAHAADGVAEQVINDVRARGGIPTINESYGVSLMAMSQQEQEDLMLSESIIVFSLRLSYKAKLIVIGFGSSQGFSQTWS